jgi:hypothetical protein
MTQFQIGLFLFGLKQHSLLWPLTALEAFRGPHCFRSHFAIVQVKIETVMILLLRTHLHSAVISLSSQKILLILFHHLPLCYSDLLLYENYIKQFVTSITFVSYQKQ